MNDFEKRVVNSFRCKRCDIRSYFNTVCAVAAVFNVKRHAVEDILKKAVVKGMLRPDMLD